MPYLIIDVLVAALTCSVTAIYFMRGARNTGISLAAWGIILFLLLQLIAFRSFSGQEIGFLGLEPWTTYEIEITRGAVILLMYGLYCSWSPSQEVGRRAVKAATRALVVYMAVMLLLLVYSILQHLEILATQYGQWVFGTHVRRPSGGFPHPHFYAVLNALAFPAILHLLRSEGIRQNTATILGFLMLLGSLISTSRVGVIITAANLILFLHYSGALRSFAAYVSGAIVAVACVIYVASNLDYIREYIEVFFSFLSSDKGVFRGRSNNWSVELSVINTSYLTLLFGHGYQPFVSHNMVLRLLQVHGIAGTILYAVFYFLVILKTIRSSSHDIKPYVNLTFLPIALGSITVPFLVSVPLNAAVLLMLTSATVYYHRRVGPLPRSHRVPARQLKLSPAYLRAGLQRRFTG